MNAIEQIKQLENEIEWKQLELKRLNNAATDAVMEDLRIKYVGKIFKVDDSNDYLAFITDVVDKRNAECTILWVDSGTTEFEIGDSVSFDRLKTEITKNEYLNRLDMEVAKIKEVINAKL